MNIEWINALIGGAIIGGAVTLMLLFNGRVTGISGIINGLMTPKADGGFLWRILFVLGLFSGGLVLNLFKPEVFQSSLNTSMPQVIIAGLLVGFGTIMGSGCTSGHGVCGLSRLSIRSLVATITFIAAGVAFVYLLKKWGL